MKNTFRTHEAMPYVTNYLNANHGGAVTTNPKTPIRSLKISTSYKNLRSSYNRFSSKK